MSSSNKNLQQLRVYLIYLIDDYVQTSIERRFSLFSGRLTCRSDAGVAGHLPNIIILDAPIIGTLIKSSVRSFRQASTLFAYQSA